MFHTIWVHSRLFGCLTKLGAQRAELVQKFVPRSRSEFFATNAPERNPLDPILSFWCVSNYLGASGTVWLPYETRGKTGRKVQKFMPRSRVRIFRNERTRLCHLDPKLKFWCISYYLGAFGAVYFPYETQCTTGRTSAKVRATKSRRNFSQRIHSIHPI